MKLWELFTAIAVLWDESRSIDEYGDWAKKEERRKKRKREAHK